ncbi:MAG: GHKL domain-containing protein [Acidimicrobiaceae bacterium]|nr:GHKL domain-containing protein [Acidimicrobiaceae bacterium]MXZ64074.1 GHKL domain-containing protein [Acidimicrobiaceae bacterium]MYF31864.1 GHKL domain-containing protein [Acidimicrobiaceae bacterium]MYG77065.1 GHKL domain-containing protein [Acidimicrobiaceae bacterium]MYJ29788.1 GHKL domain-containing protein [Acidimicrobiaceae bacterium]
MASESPAGKPENPIAPLSLRRKSVQLMLALTLGLVVSVLLLVQAISLGDRTLIVAASACLALVAFATYRHVHTGLRVVAVEIWIRQMGEGNLDYKVSLSGNDEVNEAAAALERLRQRSIEALQLDLVRKLSEDLQKKNEELEGVLAELRQTQDQIILRQKLVELGELTAGVAHEIQNPLNFMKNFSESSEELIAELRDALSRHAEDLDDDGRGLVVGITDELAENMSRMRAHGERADRIVRDMAMIGRGGGKPQPVDINDLLNDRAKIAYHSAQALDESFEIAITSDCDPDLGELEVVPEDMGRVFFNLVGNACSAVDEKRRMAEEASVRYTPTLRLSTERTGGEMVVRIRDNGTGIPDDAMDKIFNPFYTTKPSGTGVGLGLSFCNDVVRQYGGSITAESEPGEFTEMTIRLPAVRD